LNIFLKTDTPKQNCGNKIGYTMYIVHINIKKVFKNNIFSNNKSENEVVFVYISNPNTKIYKIFDFILPIEEWAEISFSGRQNAENEDCETLKKLVHKLNFS
jgi:hypothetical protein